jgi:hypothetical protein
MVDPVQRISSSNTSMPTHVGNSLSIGSEAYNAWIAARQARINQDLLDLEKAAREELARRKAEEEEASTDEETHARQSADPFVEWSEVEDTEQPQTLSGESPRIGTHNFDEDTPFGERVAIV